MSIGLFLGEDTPMIWRGPMTTQDLQQLLDDTTLWQDLDYLVIDLPPGTGDIQLTLAQRVPVSGAVIVTTPQDIALLDAQQGAEDVREGRGAGARHRREHGRARVLELRPRRAHLRRRAAASAWPRSTACRCWARCRWTSASASRPTPARRPSCRSPIPASPRRYREIARNAAARLSLQARNKAIAFPNIVIQNT